MKKNEIIILICFIVLFISMLISYVYTCYQLKPKGEDFRIERVLKSL